MVKHMDLWQAKPIDISEQDHNHCKPWNSVYKSQVEQLAIYHSFHEDIDNTIKT